MCSFVHSLTHLFSAFLHLQLDCGCLEVKDYDCILLASHSVRHVSGWVSRAWNHGETERVGIYCQLP